MHHMLAHNNIYITYIYIYVPKYIYMYVEHANAFAYT